PEVVERTQDVVVVARREREGQERRIRDLAGRSASKERAGQQVLLASPSGRRDLRRGPDGTLVLEQSLQHADGGVERRARALRRFAVPAAVVELLADETAREALRRASEVAAERERAAVDARLDLAFEKRLRAKLLVPAVAGLEPSDRRGDARIAAIDAGRTQQLQREERRQPVRGVRAVPRAIQPLAGEDFGADPLVRDPRALRGNRRRRGAREVAHRVPADGRVGIEQPIDGVHGAILSSISLRTGLIRRMLRQEDLHGESSAFAKTQVKALNFLELPQRRGSVRRRPEA